MKRDFANASILKGGRVVFNIAGNKYRIVLWINYPYRVVYVRFIGTQLIRELKDPREAAEYLSAALEDGNMEVFLLALKDVAEALGGGFSKLSGKTRLNRENLYRMLSEKGNPELRSMGALLDALGLKLSVHVKKAS